MEITPTLINGEFVTAKSGEYIESTSPATGEAIGRIPRLGAEDVNIAIEAAERVAPSWAATRPQERIAKVLEFVDRFEARAEEFAQIDVQDNGTPIWVMRKIAQMASSFMRYQANLALEVRGETVPDEHNVLNLSVREPYGVTARIVPFNHPLMMATVKLIPALVTGNTVMLKPSEHTSLSALAIAQDLAEVFPAGVANVITGYAHEAGFALIDHPSVRRIAFVGGLRGGLSIQERAARAGVKNVSLELGGKNPLVVFPDADLDGAVEAAITGMNFGWQGESCASTSRLLVHESIHEEFIERVAERIRNMRSADPRDETADTGAISTKPQFDKVMEYIELGKQAGRLIAGGGRPHDSDLSHGLFVLPTLFDSIDPGSRIAQEEIFGPILVAMKFKNYDDAIKIANGTDFGLTASVFTSDYATAHRFARDVNAGYVWVNTVSRMIAGTPYGGVKNSGIGREGNLEELYSFTTSKNMMFSFPESMNR